VTKRWTNGRAAFCKSDEGPWPSRADDLMRHKARDFPILVRDAQGYAPQQKTEYIEAGLLGISDSTCAEGRFIHAPLYLDRLE
jgi:hypothetical protein